ncbi:MAG: galactokinase family protein, partial [Flavobacteriaceae bacterium]|nr:galactokinase family protein [Flavobacteriaceae bacterium]
MTTTTPNHTISILSPGRICLFGDHQDYLELPVIACAIDRYIRLRATPNNREVFHILMPDLEIERTINYSVDEVSADMRDYFLSVLRVLKRNGVMPNRGYDISISGNIPINAGLSSSSALVAAWVLFLHEAFGNGKTVSSEQIARQTYEAEVLEYNEPGGLMDQYTISLGNVLLIDTCQPVRVETLSNSLKGLVIGESGIPKETLGVLSELRTLA